MIPRDFSALWPGLSPWLANHLWQSTLFAAAAGLLTLTLQQNQARTRYWIWLAASLKFLIPFAPLITLGKQLSWLQRANPGQAGLYVTILELGQPFTRTVTTAIGASATPVHASVSSSPFLPALFLIWWAGFLVVVAIWCVRWRRISEAIRQSTPLVNGPECETLRRLENTAGVPAHLKILSSPTALEPGIFGILRPVLLWPEGISQHLAAKHLEAVLAHELCHVRRRDNLAAALHMMVEALFWFHPLVWWMGARLIDERERACDERVLEFGGRREVYAESILKVCEFCVRCPLACVAAVTGSDLKKRMVHIMSEHIAQKLDFSRKLLITTAAVLAIAIPIAFGVFDATPSRAQTSDDSATTQTFQSFSIKPSQEPSPEPTYAGSDKHMTKMMLGAAGFFAANVTMATLIEEAYGVQADQIAGGPDWLNTDRFDVQANLDKSQMPSFGPHPEKDHSMIQQMLQAALTQNTQLAVHTETKNLPTYALVVAEGGSKLQPAPTSDNSEGGEGMVGVHRMMMQKGSGGQVVGLSAQATPMANFADQLSRQLGIPVVDKTGLKGNYNFNLQWAAEAELNAARRASVDNPAPASADTAQSLSTALEQQLGLKLVFQTQAMPVVVIDRIEKPTGDQSQLSSPVPVSEEAMDQLILKKVAPVYAEPALQAHIAETVVLDAIIGKQGDVENLQIASGRPELVPAAIDAAKQWKYRPYLQQGEPVEVATQLQVSFPSSE
jgi:bla regulator protein blaR1